MLTLSRIKNYHNDNKADGYGYGNGNGYGYGYGGNIC